MDYTVVFDISQSGYRQWPFAASGLIFVAIGIGLVFIRRHLHPRIPSFVPFLWIGFAIFWTLFAFLLTGLDYAGLASAFRKGRCEMTEGIVSDFHPMTWGKKGEGEWFVVNGKRFEYSDSVISAGFNKTASHGGPIRKGVRVRIHHLGNDIAKLEIAR